MDEICIICKEPKSAHVLTSRGPFTHPREARMEGHYEGIGGGIYYSGLNCSECVGGVCEGHPYQGRWIFIPDPPVGIAHGDD